MPTILTCPTCSAKIRAPEQLVGKRVKCPKCRETLTVPAAVQPNGEPSEREQGVPFTCPTCDETYCVSEELAGKAIKCRACGEWSGVGAAAASHPASAVARQPAVTSPTTTPLLKVPELKDLPKPGFPWLPVVLVAAPLLILLTAGVAFVIGVLATGPADQIHASAQPPAHQPASSQQAPEPSPSPAPALPRKEQTEFDMSRGLATYRHMAIGLIVCVDHFQVQADDLSFPSDAPSLLVAMRITNVSDTHTIHYNGWNDPAYFASQPTNIHDEFGNTCIHQAFFRNIRPVKQAGFTLLQPHEYIDDLMVFEVPSPRATRLTLTLPLNRVDLEPDAADSVTLTFPAPPRR